MGGNWYEKSVPAHLYIEHVASWMGTNRLQLNAAKTEFIWFIPPRRRHQFPSDQLAVGSVQVTPAASARDLGVYLDSNVNEAAKLTNVCCDTLLLRHSANFITLTVTKLFITELFIENESVHEIIINDTINVFLTAISILVISNHNSFRVLFDKIASVYFI